MGALPPWTPLAATARIYHMGQMLTQVGSAAVAEGYGQIAFISIIPGGSCYPQMSAVVKTILQILLCSYGVKITREAFLKNASRMGRDCWLSLVMQGCPDPVNSRVSCPDSVQT